jgi:PII-like signaling protein
MKRYIGDRKKLKIYIDSDDKFDSKPLWEAILKEAKEYGLAGATVYKAVAGMGAHSELHTFSVWSLSQKLPLIVEIIDTEAKIRGFLTKLDTILQEGLVTLEDIEVIAYKHPKFGQ